MIGSPPLHRGEVAGGEVDKMDTGSILKDQSEMERGQGVRYNIKQKGHGRVNQI
jgi:hypothetical protein